MDEYKEMMEGIRLRNAGQRLYEVGLCRTCGDRLPEGTNTHLDCWAAKKHAEPALPRDVQ